jgi:hypothetical protein
MGMDRARLRWSLAAALCGAALIAAVAYLRGRPDALADQRRARERLVASWLEEGQREYKTIKMTPISALGSIESVRANLDAAVFTGTPPEGAGGVDSVLDAAAEFIYYRYVNTSVEEYKRWRRSRGYSMIPWGILRDTFHAHNVYEHLRGEPVPEGMGPETIFDRAWEAVLTFDGGAIRPVAIAAEAKGLTGVFGELTKADPYTRKAFEGPMRWELWRGGVAGTSTNWWSMALSRQDLLNRYARISYADLGIVVEFASGMRVPIALTFYWDPSVSRWRIEHYNMYNCPPERFPTMVY